MSSVSTSSRWNSPISALVPSPTWSARDHRAVAEQYAALLEPPYPLLDARAGQADHPAEFGPAGAAVQPERLDQLPIDRVHDASCSPQIRKVRNALYL